MSRHSGPKPYLNPYLSGTLLGIVLFLAYFITGSGLGASGGLNRLLVYVQNVINPEHIDQVAYLLKMAGGNANPLDSWIVFLTVGTIVGGFTRWIMAFIGGALMGYGARLARGCTSGQALSGGAVLSVGSWAFMFAVFAGAYALAYFFRKFWN